MKTIAILTDFTSRSHDAAIYAMHLAQKIKANVLVFNAFVLPATIPMAAQTAWPMSDFDEVKSDTERDLEAFCRKLKTELKEESQPGQFQPSLDFRCEEGLVVDAIKTLQTDRNLVLMVIATHGANELSTFLLGNSCRELIDDAKVPLLIVPEKTHFKDLEKIAFATDLTLNDVNYINSVSELARQFNAGMMLAHVDTSNVANEQEREVNLFMKEVVNHVDYGRVYYRHITNHNVKKGLDWLLENVKVDMLAIVHRKSSFWDFLFKSSVTKHLAAHTHVPLLVFPYPVEHIPAF